jgi:S-(hydroxymethyl)glutathione dehydrogenase/alcohol dehydrogenase
VNSNPDREAWVRKLGMTDFVDARAMERAAIVAEILSLTDGGADFSFNFGSKTGGIGAAREDCRRSQRLANCGAVASPLS